MYVPYTSVIRCTLFVGGGGGVTPQLLLRVPGIHLILYVCLCVCDCACLSRFRRKTAPGAMRYPVVTNL